MHPHSVDHLLEPPLAPSSSPLSSPPPSSSSIPLSSSSTLARTSWISSAVQTVTSEVFMQQRIGLPLIAMNLAWYAKTTITTSFLGRLGELELAAGTLGFTFANVTGFLVLSGLCRAMEPICGQAFGAKNYKLLHKTLLMATILLLGASVPISLLWLNVDKLLILFGQQPEIATLAKRYLKWLLPDLVITSLLRPLKAYLSSQGITLPILFSSGLALGFHIPLNIFLSRKKGMDGVAIAIWLTDMSVTIMLSVYIFVNEKRKNCVGETMIGGWWDQRATDWVRLLRLSAPCCLTTCLEWWCYEILVLLTGRLPDARRTVSVIAIVLNFDYLLFSVMLSLATCASIRVSNELGAGNTKVARMSAFISISCSATAGIVGALVMVMARRIWGHLFTHDAKIIEEASKMMLIMALLEVVNFPLAVCSGIVRGAARPWLGMYANLGGFYLIALPAAVILGFKVRLGLAGLLMGFVVGALVSAILLIVLVLSLDWDAEAKKAKSLADAETRNSSESSDGVTI